MDDNGHQNREGNWVCVWHDITQKKQTSSFSSSSQIENPSWFNSCLPVSTVSCGSSIAAFTTECGRLYCWQTNYSSSEKPYLSTPCMITGSSIEDKFVISVSCGDNHLAALDDVGSGYVFGSNKFGQLGLGPESPEYITEAEQIGGPGVVSQLACGPKYTLVLTEIGDVYSTGDGTFGVLGLGDTEASWELEKIEFGDYGKVVVVEIAAGTHHALALAGDGSLYGWGSNCYGQLGLGDKTDRAIPSKVTSELLALPLESMQAGRGSLCVRADRQIVAWGIDDKLVPTVFEPPTDDRVLQITMSKSHLFCMMENGKLCYRSINDKIISSKFQVLEAPGISQISAACDRLIGIQSAKRKSDNNHPKQDDVTFLEPKCPPLPPPKINCLDAQSGSSAEDEKTHRLLLEAIKLQQKQTETILQDRTKLENEIENLKSLVKAQNSKKPPKARPAVFKSHPPDKIATDEETRYSSAQLLQLTKKLELSEDQRVKEAKVLNGKIDKLNQELISTQSKLDEARRKSLEAKTQQNSVVSDKIRTLNLRISQLEAQLTETRRTHALEVSRRETVESVASETVAEWKAAFEELESELKTKSALLTEAQKKAAEREGMQSEIETIRRERLEEAEVLRQQLSQSAAELENLRSGYCVKEAELNTLESKTARITKLHESQKNENLRLAHELESTANALEDVSKAFSQLKAECRSAVKFKHRLQSVYLKFIDSDVDLTEEDFDVNWPQVEDALNQTIQNAQVKTPCEDASAKSQICELSLILEREGFDKSVDFSVVVSRLEELIQIRASGIAERDETITQQAGELEAQKDQIAHLEARVSHIRRSTSPRRAPEDIITALQKELAAKNEFIERLEKNHEKGIVGDKQANIFDYTIIPPKSLADRAVLRRQFSSPRRNIVTPRGNPVSGSGPRTPRAM